MDSEMIEKKSKKEFKDLSGKKQYYHLLKFNNNQKRVVGKILKINEEFYAENYNEYGKRIEFVKKQGLNWGIPIAETVKVELAENMYIVGELEHEAKRAIIGNIEKLDSEEEFREKLYGLLKEKWAREGFLFTSEDIVKYEDDIKFANWVAEKVEASLEDRYEKFIENEMNLSNIEYYFSEMLNVFTME